MKEGLFSFHQLEHPASGNDAPAGWLWLHGWVWPKIGEHFVDIRARHGAIIFPGILGYPRADLAAHFGATRALAGYRIQVELPPGPTLLSLEVLDLEGRWREFDAIQFNAIPVDRTADTGPKTEPLRWHDFCRGLDLLLRSQRHSPDGNLSALAATLAAELPRPHDLLEPRSPWIGHADEPAMVNHSRLGRIPVVGYLFRTDGPVRRLWAGTDLLGLQPLKVGRATANLIPHFPSNPAAATSGYEGMIDVAAQLPNPVTVRLYAEAPDGSLELVQARRTRRHDAELEKLPWLSPTEATFERTLKAWRSALQSNNYPVSDEPDLPAALEQLRQRYLRAASACMPTNRPVHRTVAPSHQAATRLRQIVAVSHNLNLEGAPLFLLDLVGYYLECGVQVRLISAADGPLRPQFTALGATVEIVDPSPVFSATGEEQAKQALNTLAAKANLSDCELVITNTFTTFWAVHCAHQAGRPVLSYVHESTTPEAFYRESLHPAVLALVEVALELADKVSFTSAATRAYHDRAERPIRATVTPGWVDLGRIQAWRSSHPRPELRSRLGISDNLLLVTNIGTVSDRKGQHGFARAVNLFNRRYPALSVRTRFVLLGGRQSPFDEMLAALLADLALPNLTVHPETPEYLPYFAAADLTVCSSLEESSPRVVLEAMACGTPLLASNIPGISELVRPELEATLVPVDNAPAWAEALARLLHSPEIGVNLSKRASARAERHFASAHVLPQHMRMASELAQLGSASS